MSRKASMDIAMDLVSRRRERPFGIGPFVVDLTEIQSTAQLVAYTRGVLVAPGPRVIDILEFRDSFDSAPDQRTFKNPFTVLIGAHHKFDEQNALRYATIESTMTSVARLGDDVGHLIALYADVQAPWTVRPLSLKRPIARLYDGV